MRPSWAPLVSALLAAVAVVGCAPLRTAEHVTFQVSAAHAALIAAYNTCDAEKFSSAYATDFTFTTSHTASAYTTVTALRGYHAAGCRQTPSPQVTLKSQEVRQVDTVVFLSGQYVFRIATATGVRDVTQNYTAVFRYEAGAWRITVHHVSLAP